MDIGWLAQLPRSGGEEIGLLVLRAGGVTGVARAVGLAQLHFLRPGWDVAGMVMVA
jgi:hypothetical protein